jgi:hypothetical protein
VHFNLFKEKTMFRSHSPPKQQANALSTNSSPLIFGNYLGMSPLAPSGQGADAKRRCPNLRQRGQVVKH